MARITVPLNEAIQVLTANVQLGDFIKRIEATPAGPRLVIKSFMGDIHVVIRFIKFENATAYFSVEGVPSFINLNSVLKLPEGITVNGTLLKISPDVLIRSQLNLKGLSVANVAWINGSFQIDTYVY